jgi:hypothetical protein
MTPATVTETQKQTATWRSIFRVVVKAGLLFALFNLVFALLDPIEALGSVSLYNTVLPGRERLPYGEDSARSYNLSLYNIPAMLHSHVVAQPKAAGEFRVLVIGDSATWGWFLKNDDTLAGNLNAQHLTAPDGRRIVAYNLGYPILSLTKDVLILDAALAYQPDLIVWPVTLESFPRDKQLFSPIVQNNAARVRRLIDEYGLQLDRSDPRLVERDFWGQTIVGQRRALADWLRLQIYGFSWAATGIDQYIPDRIKLRQSDFEADVSWQSFKQPATLTENDLAFDVLAAGVKTAGPTPILIVNEPIFISTGKNSDLRYNSFYPRWAYDQYHALLAGVAQANGWRYLDVWNSIAPDQFTDTPVHLTPQGSAQYASSIGAELLQMINHQN